jgi:hypothetical protein
MEKAMSNARQEIISALKGAGHAMSISQIMAAVERTDRNAVDQLLHKMRKAGEIEVAGRGLYTLGKNISAPDQSDQEQSYREGQSGAEGGKIEVAVRLQKTPDQPWRMSDVDAARRADQYRAARAQKGEAIANRVLRWELQDAGVPYQRLQGEVERIQQLAGH